MRKITVMLAVMLLLISNVCFASSYELVFTDSLNSQIYLDKDSVKPLKYKMWDCYQATAKYVFSKPMGNIASSVLSVLVNKENKDYSVVYIENYDANNVLVSSQDKSGNGKISWDGYDAKKDICKVVDKIIQISKEGK